jgi:GNAT superfamily N-acetyltransferase
MGTIQLLLEKSYQTFHEQFPEYLDENTRSFNECDTFFYGHPEIAIKCSFISLHEGNLVGMACWDPRNYPSATIGHNCILPAFKGLGLGKEQMGLVISLLREKGFKEAKVSTGLMEFFIPAQKMYTGVGFKESRRELNIRSPRLHDNIYYQMEL